MGNETITIQNLQIIEVNAEENYILVSGNVPGPKNSLVLIRSAVKNSVKKNPKDVISYEEETVVDEVEVTEEATPVTEEVVETPVEESTESTQE